MAAQGRDLLAPVEAFFAAKSCRATAIGSNMSCAAANTPFLGVSRPEAPRIGQHSWMIVPMGTPGLLIVRELGFLGWEDSIAPIAELVFENVRVPAENWWVPRASASPLPRCGLVRRGCITACAPSALARRCSSS
jgi:hypothetical protein